MSDMGFPGMLFCMPCRHANLRIDARCVHPNDGHSSGYEDGKIIQKTTRGDIAAPYWCPLRKEDTPDDR